MSVLFSQTEIEVLQGDDIAPQFFVKLDFPVEDGGPMYLTDAPYDVTIDDQVWQGVTDPIGGRLVTVSEIPSPIFGDALTWSAVVTGIDRAFLNKVFNRARNWEGRDAEVFYCLFDTETGEQRTGLKPLFPGGKMSTWRISSDGVGRRQVGVLIEGGLTAFRYRGTEFFSPTSHKKRHPGDKFFDYIGVEVQEVVK